MAGVIKAFIFDLGNVVVDFDHWIAVKKISEAIKKPPQDVYQLFFDSELTKTFEEGKISPRDFYKKIKDIVGFSLSYKEFIPIWDDIFFLTDKNLGVQKIIGKLKEKYKIALLSNINKLHYEYLKKHFQVFSRFDKIIVSYKVQARKPDEAIYQEALKALKATKNEVIYTDDRQDLIDAAKKIGIMSFRFSDCETFKKDLASLGIII